MCRLDWRKYTEARAAWEAGARDPNAVPQPASYMEKLDGVPQKLAAVEQLRRVYEWLAAAARDLPLDGDAGMDGLAGAMGAARI